MLRVESGLGIAVLARKKSLCLFDEVANRPRRSNEPGWTGLAKADQRGEHHAIRRPYRVPLGGMFAPKHAWDADHVRSVGTKEATVSTILLVFLVLLLIRAIPAWPHSRSWGYGPTGALGLVLIVLLILALTGRI